MKFDPSSHTTRTISILLTLAALPVLHADDNTWNGTANGFWADLNNWNTATTVPGTGDTATFDTNGGTVDLIDFGGAVTVSHLTIDSASVTDSYTFGVAGVDTLNLDLNADNTIGINMSNTVTGDQTIAADIVLGDGSADVVRIANLSATNDLNITGDISTGTGSLTPGIVVVNLGNFNQSARTINIDGDVLANTTATRLALNAVGAEVNMNGVVSGGGNTQRTSVQSNGTITVGATGKIGEGNISIQWGTLNLNNTTTPQLLDNGITLGNGVAGNGDAAINIAAGATLLLNSDITYVADSVVANLGSVNGGTVDLDSGARTITVNDNAAVAGAEVTVSTNFKGNGNTNATAEDFTIRGPGTLAFNSTFDDSNPVELVDGLFLENGKTIIQAGGTDMTPMLRGLVVRQRNNAALSDFDVEMDINGQELLMDDDLVLGAYNNASITTFQNVRITDSADSASSKIRFTDDNDILVNNGSNTSNGVDDNLTVFVEADLQFEDSNFTINVEEGPSDVDLDISGTITSIPAGVNNLFKDRDGTLKLTATDNDYNILQIARGRVQIDNGGALGANDIQLGNNNFDGTLEYIGTGETLNKEIRIGEFNVGTDTGAAILLNNGSGTLTFSGTNFNQQQTNSSGTRILQLGGTSDAIATGILRDNNTGTSGLIGVTKNDANTWTLSGANTYSGDTTVNAGRLNVNGTVGGNLNVAAGASVGGNATFAGTVTLGAGTNLRVDGPSGAMTAVGAIDTSAGVNVFIDTGVGGPITVLNYNNGVVNNIDVSHFTLAGGVPASARGAGPFVDTGSSITIDLGFGTRTWDNASTDGLWNEGGGSSANWIEGDNVFFDGDSVTFTNSDVNAGAPAVDEIVTLGVNVDPGTIEFSNNTNTYTIDDNGGGEAITGSGSLTKSGAAAVTINSVNSYSGGTLISQGQLFVSNDWALGTGTVTMTDAGIDPDLRILGAAPDIANDFVLEDAGSAKRFTYDVAGGNAEMSGDIINNETATWTFQVHLNATANMIFSGVISGTGAVRGRNGTLTLTNATNTFTGPLRADNSGTVVVSTITDTGVPSNAGAGDYMIAGSDNGNGTISYIGTGGSTDRQVQTGAGAGNTPDVLHSGSGAFENNGTGAFIFTNATFTRADTSNDSKVGARTITLGGTNTDANEVQGSITDNAGIQGVAVAPPDNTVGLIKDGVGTWCLSGTNTYTGDTTVNNGELCFSASDSLPAGADVYVDAAGGGVLNLDFAGTVSIGSLIIDGAAVAAGEWGSVASGAANTSPALLGAGTFDVTVGGTTVPNIIDIVVDGSGDVILTLDGPAAGLTAQQSDDLDSGFADVVSAAGATTLTVDSSLVDPNADGYDFYRVRN